MKSCCQKRNNKVSVNLSVKSSSVNLGNLLQVEKFSDVVKLYRVTAYVSSI